MKAAFLYNFTKFIEWPATSFSGPSDPFTLCVYGTNPFGDSLESLVKGKTIDGREFAVRDVASPSQARGCQVLFISRAERGHVADILASARRTGLLTVGETKGFVDEGGDINFVLESNHVRFEINARAAQKAGLKISSRLLSLATDVRQ
ncbi:MAG TPA: YfiR family protein [Terriglobia bacterium]|nr:YfiR family protein [Terriglobia bacterium]